MSARLKELLPVGSGFSERAFARKAGIGPTTLRRILAGDDDPRLSVMLRLARALGLRSVEELIAPLGTMLLLETEPPVETEADDAA